VITPSFSFVQITDSHVGHPTVPTAKALQEDLQQIQAEVGKRASFIIITGDLTDRGTEPECQMVADAMKSISLKIYPVVGDHDYLNSATDPSPYDGLSYKKVISPLNYSFDFQGVQFISYDCIAANNEEWPSVWLKKELSKKSKDKPIIFLSHRPLRSDFFDELQEYPIIATLSGHWHTSKLYQYGKIHHYNSPPVSFGGIDYSPRGYRLFTWTGTKLELESVRLNQKTSSIQRTPSNSFKIRWKAPLKAQTRIGAPALGGDRLFLGLMNENTTSSGAVASWNLEDGRELWRTPVSSSIKNSVSIADDHVVAVTVTGEVVAMNTQDGKMIWRYQLGNPSHRWLFSSPAISNGRVYVGPGSCFTALDLQTGEPLWVRKDLTPPNDWISSHVSPACDGTHVFVGFFWKPHTIGALDTQTGRTRWQLKHRHLEAPVSAYTHSSGSVYIIRHNGNLQKLRSDTGTLEWEFSLGEEQRPTPEFNVDKSGWSNPCSGESWSPTTPCVEGNSVYVSSGGGKVVALETSSGKLLWQWECEDDLWAMHPYRRSGKTILSSPKIFGNQVIIGTNDGRLVALNKSTGTLEIAHDFQHPVTNTAAVLENKFWIPVQDGNLYCLNKP
jgi:outer membrane protein assembly factor BamB